MNPLDFPPSEVRDKKHCKPPKHPISSEYYSQSSSLQPSDLFEYCQAHYGSKAIPSVNHPDAKMKTPKQPPCCEFAKSEAEAREWVVQQQKRDHAATKKMTQELTEMSKRFDSVLNLIEEVCPKLEERHQKGEAIWCLQIPQDQMETIIRGMDLLQSLLALYGQHLFHCTASPGDVNQGCFDLATIEKQTHSTVEAIHELIDKVEYIMVFHSQGGKKITMSHLRRDQWWIRKAVGSLAAGAAKVWSTLWKYKYYIAIIGLLTYGVAKGTDQTVVELIQPLIRGAVGVAKWSLVTIAHLIRLAFRTFARLLCAIPHWASWIPTILGFMFALLKWDHTALQVDYAADLPFLRGEDKWQILNTQQVSGITQFITSSNKKKFVQDNLWNMSMIFFSSLVFLAKWGGCDQSIEPAPSLNLAAAAGVAPVGPSPAVAATAKADAYDQEERREKDRLLHDLKQLDPTLESSRGEPPWLVELRAFVREFNYDLIRNPDRFGKVTPSSDQEIQDLVKKIYQARRAELLVAQAGGGQIDDRFDQLVRAHQMFDYSRTGVPSPSALVKSKIDRLSSSQYNKEYEREKEALLKKFNQPSQSWFDFDYWITPSKFLELERLGQIKADVRNFAQTFNYDLIKDPKSFSSTTPVSWKILDTMLDKFSTLVKGRALLAAAGDIGEMFGRLLFMLQVKEYHRIQSLDQIPKSKLVEEKLLHESTLTPDPAGKEAQPATKEGGVMERALQELQAVGKVTSRNVDKWLDQVNLALQQQGGISLGSRIRGSLGFGGSSSVSALSLDEKEQIRETSQHAANVLLEWEDSMRGGSGSSGSLIIRNNSKEKQLLEQALTARQRFVSLRWEGTSKGPSPTATASASTADLEPLITQVEVDSDKVELLKEGFASQHDPAEPGYGAMQSLLSNRAFWAILALGGPILYGLYTLYMKRSTKDLQADFDDLLRQNVKAQRSAERGSLFRNFGPPLHLTIKDLTSDQNQQIQKLKRELDRIMTQLAA